MHKEIIAVQNALSYYFALLSPARFSEFEWTFASHGCISEEKFPRRIFSKRWNFRVGSWPPATTPIIFESTCDY